MKFVKQYHNTCLGAAIAMVCDAPELHESYRSVHQTISSTPEGKEPLIKWLEHHAPWAIGCINIGAYPGASTLPSLHGKGVVVVHFWNATSNLAHALAYQDGRVLDPNGNGEWETLMAHMDSYRGCYEIAVAGVFPAPEEVKCPDQNV
jgi:hypothetical protein